MVVVGMSTPPKLLMSFLVSLNQNMSQSPNVNDHGLKPMACYWEFIWALGESLKAIDVGCASLHGLKAKVFAHLWSL